MRKHVQPLFLFALLVFLIVPATTVRAQTTYYADAVGGSDANDCLTPGTACETIGAALALAIDGDTIEMAAGTYSETINITQNNLTLSGAGIGSTILDVSGGGGDYGIDASVNGLTLEDFSVAGNSGSYSVKIAGINATTKATTVTVQNLQVDDSQRTGVDINGVDGVILTNITVNNTVAGNGVALTDVDNAVLTDITTSGNAWGGVAIYTYGRYYPLGSDNITLDNIMGDEPNPVYIERGNYNNPGSPEPITNLNRDDYDFSVENTTFRAGAENFTFLFDNQADALAFAAGLTNPEDSYVTALLTGDQLVGAGMSIQAAIDAADPGDTITVGDGTYNENLSIAKNITLLSENGRATTIIEGISSVGSLGAIVISSNTTAVQIGDTGMGFTIIGIDNGAPGVENAAVYFQGSHSGATLRDNEIQANGDHGLLTEYGATIDGFVIDNNEFSGQTFVGAQPAGIGFGSQFTTPNVPRQLVTMGNGGGTLGTALTTNITFTNNLISGTAGGISSDDNVSEQGNTLVTIDAATSTITGNTFAGTTTRFGSSLRVRRPGTDISSNNFDSTNMGASTIHLFVQNNTDPVETIAANNTFDVGVYVEGGTFVAYTIQGAVTAASPNDVVGVTPGTYSETNIIIDKALTVRGNDPSDTFVELGGGNGFYPQADGITIQDLTIQNGGQGVRFEIGGGGTIDNTELNNVTFLDNSSRGIEVHNLMNMTDLRIIDCLFDGDGGGTGIRFSSSATGDGIMITGTTFQDHALGFYQANDGGTGNVQNVTVDDATFVNHTDTAFFAEEIFDSTIENSEFTDNHRGITIFKNYTGAGTDVANFTVQNNTFTDQIDSSVLYYQANSALVGPVNIQGNTVNQDVGVMDTPVGTIDVRLEAGFTHGAVNITSNEVNLSGTFGAITDAFGIKVRGEATNVNITDNALDGGSVGGAGAPMTSGLYLVSDDASMGSFGASSVLSFSNNLVNNFVYGVSVYDANGSVDGGLPAGATVILSDNDFSGNSSGGVSNGGTSETIDAPGNWWGSNAPATVAAQAGSNVDYTPWLDVGTNTSGGTGFAGDFTTLWADDDSPQTGGIGRIQEAINLVTNSTVNLAPGTYVEPAQVFVDEDVDIIGDDRTTTTISPGFDTGASGDARGFFLIDTGITFNLSDVTVDATGRLVYQGFRIKGQGSFTNVDFNEIKYNESGPHYQGVAVVPFGGDVDITNCTFSEIGRIGVLYFGAGITGSTYDGNTYTGKGAGDWLDYALDISNGAIVDVTNSTISGNTGVASSDGSTSAGILVSTFFGPGTTANITGNDILNNTVGIAVGFDAADVSTVTASNNLLDGNTAFGVSNSTTAASKQSNVVARPFAPTEGIQPANVVAKVDAPNIVDARSNDWGDPTGPSGGVMDPITGILANGIGDEVDEFVRFDPWIGKETAKTLYLTTDVNDVLAVTGYPNTTWAYTAYESGADPGLDDWNYNGTGTNVFYLVPEEGTEFGGSDVTIEWDESVLTLESVTAVGGLFDSGSSSSTFFTSQPASNQLRINASRLDNINITSVAGDYIACISFTQASAGVSDIEILQTPLSFRRFDGVGGQEGVLVFPDTEIPSVRALLGDVTSIIGPDPSTGDGLVEFEDLFIFSNAYFSDNVLPTLYKEKFDIGPTDDGTVFSLPQVDGLVEFEDLIIFSISYGLSASGGYDKVIEETAPQVEPVQVLVEDAEPVGGQLRIPVSVANAVDLRAFSMEFIGGSAYKLVGIEEGTLTRSTEARPVFLRGIAKDGSIWVDGAILGAHQQAIQGQGHLFTLVLEPVEAGNLTLQDVRMRTTANTNLKSQWDDIQIDSGIALPTEYALEQNYPNPFNPTTTISFALPEAGDVLVEVFDVTGRRMATLVNGEYAAGTHTVEWNAHQAPSGVYFYAVRAGDFQATRRMVLLK